MNNEGFTLIQSLVAIAIASIVGLGVMTFIANGYQHSSRIGVLIEGRELQSEFSELSRSTNCGILDLANPINVTDTSWNDSTEYTLTQGISGRFLDLKASDTYNGLKIEKISIAPYFDRVNKTSKYVAMDGDNSTDFANAHIVRASLKMDLSSNQGAKAPLQIPVHLFLDETGSSIVGCKSPEHSADMENMCTSISGAWNSAELRCTLPCPSGFTTSEEGCVADDSNDKASTFCATNDRCLGTVSSKYSNF